MTWDKTGELNSYFWLFSRSLLKPICSAVITANYAVGQFLSDTLANPALGSREPTIRWGNDDIGPYSREHIPLRVTVEDPGHVLLLDEHSCPRLFLRARDATPGRVIFSRSTRVDELQEVACKAGGGANRLFTMEFDVGSVLKRKDDENKGEYTLDVTSLAEIEGRYLLAGATEALHLSMVEGKFITRNWGPSVQGVAVSLNLDKDVYALGSDIPLHIALENIDSHETISAMDPYYDPPGVGVELQDMAGHPISPGVGTIWRGHGACHSFLTGLVFPIELMLSQMGFRADQPGVYTLVAVWRPIQGDCGLIRDQALPDHLTVKSSSATFRVIGTPQTPSGADAGQEKNTAK